jgi:spore maturation protein CgeB
MKVLYVAHGNFWGSTWPYQFIDQFIILTLRQMGHEVNVFDLFTQVQFHFPFFKQVADQRKLSPNQLLALLDNQAEGDLPLECLDFKPDLLLHTVGRLSPRVLKALRQIKVKTAVWFLDDPQEIDFTAQKGLFYDHVFTVEDNCVAAHRQAGSKNAAFLPLGCFPPVNKKLESVEDKYKSDICFVGVAFPDRVAFFDEQADFLKDHSVKIIGGGPNIGSGADPWFWKRKLKRLDVLEKFVIDEVAFPEEAAKYYNGAKINLNIHRGAVDERFAHGNSAGILPRGISGRTFEIAGCGAFQLIDQKRADYTRHFTPDKELVSFSDAADFQAKVKHYLAADQERGAIAAAAQARAYREHTYEDRLKKILGTIA